MQCLQCAAFGLGSDSGSGSVLWHKYQIMEIYSISTFALVHWRRMSEQIKDGEWVVGVGVGLKAIDKVIKEVVAAAAPAPDVLKQKQIISINEPRMTGFYPHPAYKITWPVQLTSSWTMRILLARVYVVCLGHKWIWKRGLRLLYWIVDTFLAYSGVSFGFVYSIVEGWDVSCELFDWLD